MSRRKKNTNANTELSAQTPVDTKVQTSDKVVLVKMVNDDGKEANVHPLEVDNYAKGGFKAV